MTNEEKKTYQIEGFSCANCAGTFEKNVQHLPGVKEAHVNFGASKLTIEGEASVEELEKAGAFENLKVVTDSSDQDAKQTERVPFYKRYQSLLFATALLLIGIVSFFINGETNVVTVLLFVTSILVSGLDLLKAGLINLRHLTFDMKTLMTVAVIGGSIIGEWMEIAIVVILFALSEELERFSMDQARQSIRSLMDIAPNQALIRRNGSEQLVNVKDIQVDDVMIVKPGSKIAMDGIVEKGVSAVNQAAITGESIPVEKTKDSQVFAGTLNEEGLLEVRVTKRSEDTTISKIIHLVEEAQAERAPAQAFIDLFAKYYTPAIMVIAFLVALLPPLVWGLNAEAWLYQGLAVLVVGCPCALVVSTPISIVSAIGNAAKKGVLIKGGVYLEAMSGLNAIAFDKTGTLTEGIPVVTDYHVLTDEQSEDETFDIMASLEDVSQHPLAGAILNEATNRHFTKREVERFQSLTGKGIRGIVEGREYYVGNVKLFKDDLGQIINPDLERMIIERQDEGKTVMLFGTSTEMIALVAVADRIRESSADTIKKLHALGIDQTIMLTGDVDRTAQEIGSQVGVTQVASELMPDDKLKRIKELKERYQTVGMLGDGVNDAPALAASTVGIAMGGAGTDTALETADVALMADDLSKLPFTIKLSRKALRIIKANITFALLIKLAALLLVVPGWLTLWIAILSDMGATLLVSLNSMRLMRMK
ncbi:Cd2+/Zn2+-exporting ATPase [Pelagirhabdus alkalitolerans]|uniref:Cd(2+)-exporting ATPase n=1 Tax=Pelagirhabdus alkalitolerans TaxID=1612202 RepID=A0A1G6JVK0_9BACI|nr:heavy metal translocating P-type ATPase [Pelagirhabdus alkalitolerans]SDC22737.1 Cd2+/Zn2+-exporting ATPase [Pelagirhabdus alkalitolerans]